MKKVFFCLFLFLYSLVLLSKDSQFVKQIDDLTKVVYTYTPENCDLIVNEINQIQVETMVEYFEKYYLLSICYFSTEPERMLKVNDNLKKACEFAFKIKIEKDSLQIIEFFIKIEYVYRKIVDFSKFSSEDLEEVIDLLIQQFELKVELAEKFNDYHITLFIKDDLSSFQENILNQKFKEEILELYNRLDKVLLNKPMIKDIKRK